MMTNENANAAMTSVLEADTGFDIANVACFTGDTKIITGEGSRRVAQLSAGMMVFTMDNGWQPIRGIISRTVSAEDALAPIVISAGALGNNSDLLVSPAHRMLICGWRSELLAGENEMMVSAEALCNDDTIYRRRMKEITYYHILFDQSEVIYASGIPAESYHLSTDTGALDDAIKAEL